MQIRFLQTAGPAALLVLIAGSVASAQMNQARADAAEADRQASPTVELIPHREISPVAAAKSQCLVLRAGVVKTVDMGACVETLAATENRMVIQLDGPLTKERALALKAAGVEIGQYLPVHAFIAPTEGVDPEAFAELDFVRWHGAYDKAWKTAAPPEDREFVTAIRQDVSERGEAIMILSLFEGADVDETARAAGAIPGAVVLSRGELGGNPMLTVVTPKGLTAKLADLEDVMAIEEAPEASLRMATSSWVVQTNQDGFYRLHDNGLDGTGQIVGVMDSAVQVDHCAFSDSAPVGPDHRKWVAINSGSGSSSHGTAVCSMIAGDDGSPGDLRGIAYKARMTFSLPPSFNESALIDRFELHHSQGARIHSNSWGNDSSSQNFYNVWSRAIDVFTHDNEDDLVVFAATNLSVLRTPENSRNVLATGATYDTPLQANYRTGGRGPTSDGRRKPELFAPGSGIRAASVFGCGAASAGTGTSFACPQIAGAAALTRQYFMEGFHPTGAPDPADAVTPSGALLKATLLNSAVDMTGEPGYPSDVEGWGRILMDNALHFAGETRTLLIEDVRNSSAEALFTGDERAFAFAVRGSGERLKVTMTFTDKEAAPAAAFVPVNDVDLEVVSPSGAVYLGNVFSGGVSVTGGSPDALNNVEQVHIDAPEIGEWTARLIGAAINDGPQGYALVVTGDVGEPLVACPADLDGSGAVDGADLAQLIAGWGTVDMTGDLDGSGGVDGADVAALIAAWGPCPN